MAKNALDYSREVEQGDETKLKATVTQDSRNTGVWPAAGAARVTEHADQDGVGSPVLYTVPAGKTLFLANVAMSTRLSAANNVGAILYVRDAGDVTVYFLRYHHYATAGQLATAQAFSPALEIAAGYDIVLTVGNANLRAWAFIAGWLE